MNFVGLLDATLLFPTTFIVSLVNWKSGKSENPNLVASNIVLAKTHKNECSIAVSFNIGLENEGGSHSYLGGNVDFRRANSIFRPSLF